MTLSSKVNDTVNLLVLHKLVECVEIADIHTNKLIVRLILDILKVCEVTCVCKLIKIDDIILWILIYEKTYYVASYKTSSACDNNILHNGFCCF